MLLPSASNGVGAVRRMRLMQCPGLLWWGSSTGQQPAQPTTNNKLLPPRPKRRPAPGYVPAATATASQALDSDTTQQRTEKL